MNTLRKYLIKESFGRDLFVKIQFEVFYMKNERIINLIVDYSDARKEFYVCQLKLFTNQSEPYGSKQPYGPYGKKPQKSFIKPKRIC